MSTGVDEELEWRAIPGWEGFYEASTDGHIRSVRRTVITSRGSRTLPSRVLSDKPVSRKRNKRDAYCFVTLCRDGMPTLYGIHFLVLLTFVGPRPIGQQCRHLDGNSTNNAKSNLSWGTALDNHNDQLAHGTSSQKLSSDLVRSIRASGLSQSALARLHGVSPSTIQKVISRSTWAHVE